MFGHVKLRKNWIWLLELRPNLWKFDPLDLPIAVVCDIFGSEPTTAKHRWVVA